MPNIMFQQESYKRGVVLGLTIAEVVLLILFTLLLALSALLAERERENHTLVARNGVLAAENSLFEKELSKFLGEPVANPKNIFLELIIARRRAAQADQLEQKLQEADKQNTELKTTLEKEHAARMAAERVSGPDSGHKWPPIINLSEADGYFFQVGSAELSEEFKAALVDKVAPKILQIAAEYPDVDVIEVIGHTDEQIIRRRYSNLDTSLIDVLKDGHVASLVPADNAGLGISRAVALVTRLLQDNRLVERFPRILPMSGAQLIQVDQTLSHGAIGDVKERRRIEIRLRKYEKAGPDMMTPGGSPK
jgi:outer membrane protein OmpA-like peptidoglycan-associated protein